MVAMEVKIQRRAEALVVFMNGVVVLMEVMINRSADALRVTMKDVAASE